MLSKREIEFVTHKWIGVSGGYLGDLDRRSHYEFYSDYCGIEDIDPYQYEGTTRQRFEQILRDAQPNVKAKILRGVLEKYPRGSAEGRTEALLGRMMELIRRCEGIAPVTSVKPTVTTAVVDQALADAEALIEGSPVSAVDRVHTAFHGYLMALCDEHGIRYEEDAGTTRLFKLLRTGCEHLKPQGKHSEQTTKILNSLASIVDAVDPLRNRGSIAHPNKDLLDSEDALLCVHAIRTLLHYLDAKTQKSR